MAVVNSAGDILATKFIWTWAPLQELTLGYFDIYLVFDILDQIWSRLKYWKKSEVWFYHKFEFCVGIV